MIHLFSSHVESIHEAFHSDEFTLREFGIFQQTVAKLEKKRKDS